jgi:hypothetical protein
LERLTQSSADAVLPQVTDAQISNYVQAVQVISEKFLGTKYVGRFSIVYDPQAVQALLAKSAWDKTAVAGAIGEQRTLFVRAATGNVAEWVRLRRTLEAFSGIHAVECESLSPQEVEIILHTELVDAALLEGLQARGFAGKFGEDENGRPVLLLGGAISTTKSSADENTPAVPEPLPFPGYKPRIMDMR